MQEAYEVKDLLIGELVTVTNGWMGTPHTSVEGPFIFFQKESGKYAEIFTEEEYGMNAPSNSTIQDLYKLSLNNEENKFGKTYVRPTLYTITQYLTEEERQQFTNGQVNFSINKKRISIFASALKKNVLLCSFCKNHFVLLSACSGLV